MTKPATYAYLDDELRADALRIESKAPEARTETEAEQLKVLARLNEAYRERDGNNRELERLRDELTDSEQGFSAAVLEFLRHMRGKARYDLAKLGWVLDEDLHWSLNGVIHDAAPDLPQAEILNWEYAIDKTFERGNAEVGFGFGLETAGLLIEAGYKPYLDRFISMMQSMRAKRPRSKPRLGSRALMIAMTEGNRTAASIAEFFDAWCSTFKDDKWRGKFKDDEWGGLSLDAADDFDGWEVIDEGASTRKDGEKPSGEIRRISLASMISRAKKKPR